LDYGLVFGAGFGLPLGGVNFFVEGKHARLLGRLCPEPRRRPTARAEGQGARRGGRLAQGGRKFQSSRPGD
jgi:hypothetical protein